MNKEEILKISGMTCNHCVMKVEKALQGVDGVESAFVDMQSAKAEVVYNSDKIDTAKLIAAVKTAGYEAKAE